MRPYLPSKSALAPKQQLYNNINFIHKSMISGAARTRCSLFSVIQTHRGGNNQTEGQQSWFDARRRRTGRTGLLASCRRCESESSPLPGSRVTPMCVCVCVWSGTHSAEKRAHSSLSLSLLTSSVRGLSNQQHPLQSDRVSRVFRSQRPASRACGTS